MHSIRSIPFYLYSILIFRSHTRLPGCRGNAKHCSKREPRQARAATLHNSNRLRRAALRPISCTVSRDLVKSRRSGITSAHGCISLRCGSALGASTLQFGKTALPRSQLSAQPDIRVRRALSATNNTDPCPSSQPYAIFEQQLAVSLYCILHTPCY